MSSTEVRFVPPMRLSERELPARDEGWAYEVKWDGQRLLAGNDRGELRLWSRSGSEVTGVYPELQAMRDNLPPGTLLDGEVVAFDEQGVSRLALLRRRLAASGTARQQRDTPVTYIAFDLLRLAGEDLMHRPYHERRRLLAGLGLEGKHWRSPGHQPGGREQLLESTRAAGLEGLVAKRLESPYLPGVRSRAWVKLKHYREERFAVGGWEPNTVPAAAALLVGEEVEGGLRYLGRVRCQLPFGEEGEGWRLFWLFTQESCFVGRQPRRPYVRCRPRLHALVRYQERTAGGWLRDARLIRLEDAERKGRF